ncbi:hypothetical protein RT761_00958 [Atribacter laminatus]|jgi:hypothetical protein|uniref:Uncharacterized protein n=1 Tax=Atribacter laminatus TaxID=2847778 RepID=A0A7T1AKS1_ATRLM|nr:hypothetical protein RT761_00958 [Atribacter laminatus]
MILYQLKLLTFIFKERFFIKNEEEIIGPYFVLYKKDFSSQ